MFLNVGLYFAARFILSMQLMFFWILMQILCVVLQKSFSFWETSSPRLLTGAPPLDLAGGLLSPGLPVFFYVPRPIILWDGHRCNWPTDQWTDLVHQPTDLMSALQHHELYSTRNFSSHIDLQTHDGSVFDNHVTFDLRVNACQATVMCCMWVGCW